MSLKILSVILNWNQVDTLQKVLNTNLTYKVLPHIFETTGKLYYDYYYITPRGWSTAWQTSKIESFAKIVNAEMRFTIFAKYFVLDVWQGFDMPLTLYLKHFRSVSFDEGFKPKILFWRFKHYTFWYYFYRSNFFSFLTPLKKICGAC